MQKADPTLSDKSYKFFDLVVTALAFGAAYYLRHYGGVPQGGLPQNSDFYLLLMAVLVGSGLSFDFFRCYELYQLQSLDRILIRLVKAVLAATTGVVLLMYLLKMQDVSRLMLALFVVFDLFFLVAVRLLVRRIFAFHRNREVNRRKILVIGSRERARNLVEYILANNEMGYQLLGCLDIDSRLVGKELAGGAKVLGVLDLFFDILLKEAVDEVIFAMPLKRIDNALDYISFAEKLGVKVRVLPDWQIQKLMYQPEIASVTIESFLGIPTMSLSSTPNKVAELFAKAVFDRMAAALGILVLSPLLVGVAVLIKVNDPGPAFFRQRRSGLNGRLFTMYKFRTMLVNAEELKSSLGEANEMDGPVFKMKEDPRVTRIGAFLRKTSLDELPQLFNVLRGDMSLVGPRPPIPAEVEEYQIWQRRRLSMKPGLTCIWQVSGRNEISFEEWMDMDLEYIDKWSLLLDFRLLLKTGPAVFNGTGS